VSPPFPPAGPCLATLSMAVKCGSPASCNLRPGHRRDAAPFWRRRCYRRQHANAPPRQRAIVLTRRSGDGARAKDLSNQGKEHQRRQDELDDRASAWIFAGESGSRGGGVGVGMGMGVLVLTRTLTRTLTRRKQQGLAPRHDRPARAVRQRGDRADGGGDQ
jgi:hypothetical protein